MIFYGRDASSSTAAGGQARGVQNAVDDLPVIRAYLESVVPELVVLGIGEPGTPGSSVGRNHPHDQHAPAHWAGSGRVFPSDAMT